PGVLDSEGYVICPDCGTRLHCGRVGLANLTEKHMGSEKCKKNRMKCDKGAKIKKDSSILTFFMKPKTQSVPSTVPGPALVDNLTPTANVIISSRSSEAEARTYHDSHDPGPGFIERFLDAIAELPENVPKAMVYDSLAVFAGNPADYNDTSMDGNELWENTLNKLLKSVFRWGEDMGVFVCCSQYGLDGLVNFMWHFVIKRKVDEGLFKGKLSHLLDRIKEMLVKCLT
ncbi:hypothetical protein BDQ17DRAFT_1255610, partial [Cyathus striatus]